MRHDRQYVSPHASCAGASPPKMACLVKTDRRSFEQKHDRGCGRVAESRPVLLPPQRAIHSNFQQPWRPPRPAVRKDLPK